MIIGITGTIGAGKGTVVEYLKHKGFSHYSARAFITAEIERRGLPVNRDTMTPVANSLREEHGSGYIIEQLFKQAEMNGGNAIIESVRSVGEAEFLKEHGAIIVAIDADRKLRYDRIVSRASETDHVSFEKFVADEERELTSTDPTKQNLLAVIETADYHILNNDGEVQLFAEIDKIVGASA
jgi:dephospho-CoA kinase